MSEISESKLSKTTTSNSKDIIISLDAMGGDNGPETVVKAAEKALKDYPELRFKIFGDETQISKYLTSEKLKSRSEVIHTTEVINDNDKPSVVIRQGRNSSMFLAIKSVKRGESSAIVSAGNTGALMAVSKIALRMLPGIDRPAICAIMPQKHKNCAMLDLGANIHCDAENLFEFAVMGHAFAKAVLDIKNPSVGLLNIGEEKNKGHEVLRQASALLEENSDLVNYYGFIEGYDITEGTVDVIVTDGFSGNIALKAIEGTVKLCGHVLKTGMARNLFGIVGMAIAYPAVKSIKKRMSPSNYNGAILLGLNGIVVKSHGSADEKGFKNAIGVAYKLAKNNINENITNEMVSSGFVPADEEFLDGEIDE